MGHSNVKNNDRTWRAVVHSDLYIKPPSIPTPGKCLLCNNPARQVRSIVLIFQPTKFNRYLKFH